MPKAILLNLVVLLAASALALGETRLVPSDQYPTIQAAVDACVDGDTVIVAPGTYTGPGNRDIDFLGKAITVRSTDRNDLNVVASTIIDCNNYGRGFYFYNAEDSNSILAGFTITNGYASTGGAVFCRASSPTIANCIITGNSAKYYGGGIFCGNSSATIANCIISNNIRGGIYCIEGHPTITNCTISQNYDGAGIEVRLGNLTASDCTIIANTGSQDGGGMCCDGYKHGGTFTISNCIIADNATGARGGGIGFERADNVSLTNCTITNNFSWAGGGVYCGDASPNIINCTITDNEAGEGAGIYCRRSNPSINNSTVARNWGWWYGGGIYCYISSATITNSIVWGNEGRHGPQLYLAEGGKAALGYTDVQGGWEGQGNIDADPCFVRPGYWDANGTPDYPFDDFWVPGDDYHLLAGSPCINAGDPNYPHDLNETDIDGQPRVWDGRVDMGADEFVPPIQCSMKFTPQAINLSSKGKWLKAHLILPEGFAVDDVDTDTPAMLQPLAIESHHINVFINDDGLVQVQAVFDRAAFCSYGSFDGTVTVEAFLSTRQPLRGTDTIRIINKSFECLALFASHWLQADCAAPDWCGGFDLDRDSVVNFVDFALFDRCCIEIITQ